MRVNEVSVGMDVVASDHPEAGIYKVRDIAGFSAELTYNTTAGMRVNSGWFDISMLNKPTEEQIANSD